MHQIPVCNISDLGKLAISRSFLNRSSQNHFWVNPFHFAVISGFMQKPEIQTGSGSKSTFKFSGFCYFCSSSVISQPIFIKSLLGESFSLSGHFRFYTKTGNQIPEIGQNGFFYIGKFLNKRWIVLRRRVAPERSKESKKLEKNRENPNIIGRPILQKSIFTVVLNRTL